MPIRFRCDECQGLLSITTRKSGQVVTCPTCQKPTRVPLEEPLSPAAKPTPAMPVAPAPIDFEIPDEVIQRPAVRSARPVADEEPLIHEEPAADKLTDLSPAFAPTPPRQIPVVPEVVASVAAASSEDNPGRVAEQSLPTAILPQPIAITVGEQRLIGSEDAIVDIEASEGEEAEGFSLGTFKSAEEEMDLTPMVDVTFLLLIFFMITASFSIQKSIETPASDQDKKGATQTIQSLEDLESVAIIVEIDAQNRVMVDELPIDAKTPLADAFRDKMRKEQKTELIVNAHRDAMHRTVVEIVDAANAAGLQKIRLVTRTPASG
jgi:biopolymer transport protein ExbD